MGPRWQGLARRLLLLGVLAAACPLACAEAAAGALEQLEHRRWIAADGGPSQVGAIAQTPDGFLWLGTNDSLMRFDGSRFVRFEPPGVNSFNIVASLLPDGDALWVGLRYGGVRRIEGGRVADYGLEQGLPEGAVYGLARDRGGVLWAAVDDGLARFDGRRWHIVDAALGFPARKARAVFVDREGVLWAASHDRLFYRPPGAAGFSAAGVAVEWASRMAQAPDGALWITERHRGMVHRVRLREGRIEHASRALGLGSSGLLFDRAGALWIATSGDGLRHLPAPASLAALDRAEHVDTRSGLSGDFVWQLYADHEGNLWAGTSAGLDRLRERTLMPASLPRGTQNVALAAAPDGSIWAGPSNRPALRIAPDGALAAAGMPAPVTAATTDQQGGVWMGGPGGIWRSQGERLVKVAPLPSGEVTESAVRALARGPDGALWVSLNRLGLFRLQDGRWQALPAPSAAPSQRMPVVASCAPDGRLWFGYRDNLAVSRDAGGERRWTREDGLDLGHVTALAHEGGRTWLGGQHGLGVIERGVYRSVGLPANGLFENIYAIVPVAQRAPKGGNPASDLWIQSRSGIFQLEAGELRQALQDPAHRVRYRSYDLMGGLANDPYGVLPLPTAVRGADGRLWFSASAGVAWIDPARPAPGLVGPVATIEAVTVDGARVATGQPGGFGPATQRVVFDYTAPSLSAPERLNFRYRLDGYDAAWHDAGRQREAVYTGLGPGAYTFRVIAYNEEGAPSSSEARYAFRIEPVFYRRPGFVLLVTAAAALGLWLLYRANLRRAGRQLRQRLEERHRERERIARELHDTLLQGFNGLVLRFQVIADSLGPQHPARAEIERILDRADQVLIEGRDRVRALRGATGKGSLEEALGETGAEAASRGETGFAIEVTGSPRRLRDEVRDEAYWIGREAIANAFAHAGAGRIDVTVDYGVRLLRLAVRDDGAGIAPEHAGPRGRPDHWGMRGMHERAAQLGGTLTVRGAPGEGSEVMLCVPAARAYAREGQDERRGPGRSDVQDTKDMQEGGRARPLAPTDNNDEA